MAARKPKSLSEVPFILDYYKSHVDHRRNMLNFLLLAGALAAAIFSRESDVKVRAFAAAVMSFLAFAFLMLDVITLAKIRYAKTELGDILGDSPLHRTVIGEGASYGLFGRDPFWTTWIEGAICIAFAAAAASGFAVSNGVRWSVLVVLGIVILLIACCNASGCTKRRGKN